MHRSHFLGSQNFHLFALSNNAFRPPDRRHMEPYTPQSVMMTRSDSAFCTPTRRPTTRSIPPPIEKRRTSVFSQQVECSSPPPIENHRGSVFSQPVECSSPPRTPIRRPVKCSSPPPIEKRRGSDTPPDIKIYSYVKNLNEYYDMEVEQLKKKVEEEWHKRRSVNIDNGGCRRLNFDNVDGNVDMPAR